MQSSTYNYESNNIDDIGNKYDERSRMTPFRAHGGIQKYDCHNRLERKFYHSNTLYHVYGITDEVGGLVEAYQYDAYGKQTVIVDGNDGDTVVNFGANDVRTVGGNSAVANPYMGNGQRFEPETALEYDKYRYRAHALGRFLSRDPIGYEDSLSLYENVRSNPIQNLDKLGLGTCPSKPGVYKAWGSPNLSLWDAYVLYEMDCGYDCVVVPGAANPMGWGNTAKMVPAHNEAVYEARTYMGHENSTSLPQCSKKYVARIGIKRTRSLGSFISAGWGTIGVSTFMEEALRNSYLTYECNYCGTPYVPIKNPEMCLPKRKPEIEIPSYEPVGGIVPIRPGVKK